MAELIKTDGSITEITPANGKTFTYDELKGFINGWLEFIYLPNGDPIILDEEGKLKQLPRNERATLMARTCGISEDDFLVGDVLVCSKEEVD